MKYEEYITKAENLKVGDTFGIRRRLRGQYKCRVYFRVMKISRSRTSRDLVIVTRCEHLIFTLGKPEQIVYEKRHELRVVKMPP